MILDVILGVTVDSPLWIINLKENFSDNIIVVDYEYYYEPEVSDGVTYMNPVDTKEYVEKFDSVNYYKSMYVYPGMAGRMSLFFKKSLELKKDEPESFPL